MLKQLNVFEMAFTNVCVFAILLKEYFMLEMCLYTNEKPR